MNIQQFHHICIQTTEYQASLEFYVDLLGFEIIKETTGFHTRDFNTWLQAANIMIELQTPKKGTNFLKWTSLNSGPVHICFVVNNVREAYNHFKNSGYHNFKQKDGQEFYEVMGSYIFKVKAPEGTEIEFRDNPKIY